MTTVSDDVDAGDFTPALGCLIRPALVGLAAQLGRIAGLGAGECAAVLEGTEAALTEVVHRKVSRVLVLELNAARITGRLTGADPAARWREFLDLASTADYWMSLVEPYPGLMSRLRQVIDNRCAAAVALARRFARTRPIPGQLVEVAFGAGDSHRGGQTVALLRTDEGRVVYKPRSGQVDLALAELLRELPTRVRVPEVRSYAEYCWAEFVEHRYCSGPEELAEFYLGIGHWLAVMRLLGGVDLHAENVIACGPLPIVVDCETLFTPIPANAPSGLGSAVDHAAELVESTVLRTGLLPGRGLGLGWRGVDASAVGALPGQQPEVAQPVIVGGGSDTAHIGVELVGAQTALNHPSPEPELAGYWNQVLKGFSELTGHLSDLDGQGRLEPMLARFLDCPIRVVPRATEVYAEVGRMLWHPVSLHQPEPAVERAARLLGKMAEALPIAPSDPEVIAAEIEDLLVGDIPFFTTTPRVGRLTGPRGTTWLPVLDLVADATRRWRAADLGLERQVIQAALVSAYLNDGWMPELDAMTVTAPSTANLDHRRRRLAKSLVERVRDAAITADDGTVTWIAPVLNETGWAVQPLSADLYGGAPGVAVLLAGYLRETAAGRADRVEGLDQLLEATLHTMRLAEERHDLDRRSGVVVRPAPPGGYIGLGSQIWAWLTLDGWGWGGADRATELASTLMPAAVKSDDAFELLTGMAGGIVPLLRLAKRTGEQRFLDLAVHIGDQLTDVARMEAGRAYWPSARWPRGLGGFAHGSTGIGWALGRLADATGEARFGELAAAAFRFEAGLWDEARQGWLDLREDSPGTAAAWCHGAVGIGLSTSDSEVLRRAAQATWRDGFGWNHTLCHGDLGCWELLDRALRLNAAPAGVDRAGLEARVLGSLEEHGPISGLARDAFAPGLLPGLGGVAYQLLRMHPESDLPSVLLL